jgi:ribosomal protein S18 acetylase RimI-like enzyme
VTAQRIIAIRRRRQTRNESADVSGQLDGTTTRIRRARPSDAAALVEMQREFYAEDRIEHAPANARALQRMLRSPQVGVIWILESAARRARSPIGYLVLTLGYSLERGGRDSFIDELYVRPASRGRGLGARAVATAEAAARRLGVRAVHLEVDTGNDRARRLYERSGFALRRRYHLMTKVL